MILKEMQPMLNTLNIFIRCALGTLLTIPAMASDFHSPRTAALGGAGHASPLLSDAIYLNPSFSSFMKTHALSLNYLLFGEGTITTPSGISNFYGHNLNLSVLDGTEDSLFQAGVGYTGRDDASLIHVAASKSFFEILGVGIGGKFIFPNNNSGSRNADATLSVSGLLTSWFQTALIVDNLIETSPQLGFYREWTLGTKFNIMSIVLIYLDPHWVPTLPAGEAAWGYEAGLEFPFFNQIFLRMGSFEGAMVPYQARRGMGYGIGLGWLAPKISLDYSFSRVISPLSSLAHNFGVTIYF